MEPYPDARLGLADGLAAPEARYEQRESVELAFVAALQVLPPGQRATLIMREVLGFSAREVAESLGTTVASVNSALQRARRALGERLPEQSQQATLRALGERELEAIVRAYMDAMERGDVPAVVAMLTDDAIWSMPPIPSWYDRPAAIAVFLRDQAHGRAVAAYARRVPTGSSRSAATASAPTAPATCRPCSTCCSCAATASPRSRAS